MATSSFYNDNLYRTYPFVSADHSALSNDWLAGIRVRLIFGARFETFPSVFLTEWRTEGGVSTLRFSCEDATHTAEKTVSIPAGLPPFSPVIAPAGDEMVQITLITGNPLQEDTLRSGLRLRVEPTCVLWLQHRGIMSVQVGNRPRRVVPLPEEVEYEPYDKAEWWQQGGAEKRLTGPLLFGPGFNCRLSMRSGNRLQMEAVKGAGLGEVNEDLSKGCTSILGTMVCEEPPADYLRRDGLPDDHNVLYAFCGAVGPHIRMTSTSTILLTAAPETHTITIGVGNLGGDVC